MRKNRLIPIYFLFFVIATSSCQQTDGELLKNIQRSGIDLPVGTKMTVSDRIVYLDGNVESDSISKSIVNSLKLMKGIDSIENNLKIVPSVRQQGKVEMNDNLLQSRIASALLADGFSKVRIEVQDGRVKIKGNVLPGESSKILSIVRGFDHDSLMDEMVVVQPDML